MEAEITNYFCSLFESQVGDRMEELLDRISPRITSEMNEFLTKEITRKEVRKALDSVGGLKAPGVIECRLCSSNDIGILWVTRWLRKFLGF